MSEPHNHVSAASEVLDFLNSIEGAGYGGMASFEIARQYVREMVVNGVAQPAAECLNELDRLAYELEEWIRQPDWSETFSLEDMTKWVNERPTSLVWKLRALAQPSPAATVDLTNHHNALKCPYCNPKGLQFAEPHEGCSAESWLADWSSLPRDLYVTSVKSDGIVFNVTCCSVPMAIGPEVRYVLNEPQTSGVWQPIDSAPQDGTRILATGGGLGETVEVVTYNERVGCWNAETCTLDDTDHEPQGYNRPTHWQPMPDTSSVTRPHLGGENG